MRIFAFAINPSNPAEMYYTGTVLNEDTMTGRSVFYRTKDGGANWETRKLPTNTIPAYAVFHPKENVLFLGFTYLDKN